MLTQRLLSLLSLSLILVPACGPDDRAVPPPAPDGVSELPTSEPPADGTPEPPAAPTPEDRRACHHVYDCGIVFTDDAGVQLDRAICDTLRLSDVDPSEHPCIAMPICSDMLECLGFEAPPPPPPPAPVCNDAFERAMARGSHWGGIWCLIDGTTVYDARCLSASLRLSFNIYFQPDGSFEAEVLTGQTGDVYDSRLISGRVDVGCETVDLTSCGRTSEDLPVSFDGTYLQIGSQWRVKLISYGFGATSRRACQ